MSCPLCEREKLTHWYYEDLVCWVADCLTCGPGHPVIVIKWHRSELTNDEKRYFLKIIHDLFPDYRGIRTKARQIKDHAHYHILLGD